jgi:hypothetical protein
LKESTGDMRIDDTFISNAFSLSDRNHDIDELSPQEEKFPKLVDSLIPAPALAHL